MLRDRLVCGMRDRRLQQHPLAETDLTFQKALDISQAIEAAERTARDLHAKQTPKPILALNQPTRPPYSQGRPNHLTSKPSATDVEVHIRLESVHLRMQSDITAKGRGTLLRCVVPRLGMKGIRWLIAKVCRTKAMDEGNKMAHC